MVVLLTPGQAGDSPMFLPLMARLRVARPVGRPRTRPDAVRGDKAYSSRAIRAPTARARHHRRDPRARRPEGPPQQAKSRGGRPVSYDPDDYRGRDVIARRFCHLKQWRGLATRYDKHAITYRAAVVLHAVIAWTQRLSEGPRSPKPSTADSVEAEQSVQLP